MSVPAITPNSMLGNKTRLYWIDYLRSFNIIGVVCLHSFLAYSPTVQRLDPVDLIKFPYVDPATSLPYADLILLLLPVYTLDLMFFISGLFAWTSLQKRGALSYTRYRFSRLIIPLVAMAILVMPITYWPTDITLNNMHPHLRLAHLWFLWVLFLFDIVLASAFKVARAQIERIMGSMTNNAFYAFLALSALLAYVPIAQAASKSDGWITLLGPLMLPISRVGIYFVYFLSGVLAGSRCVAETVKESNLFSPYSTIRIKPCFVYALSIVTWIVMVISRIGISFISRLIGPNLAWSFFNALFVLAGLTTIASLILLSKQLLNRKIKILDVLSKDSYTIYLLHYTFVVWLQFLLNKIGISGWSKPWMVVTLAIPISWLAADLVRRLPLANRVLVSS